MPYAASKAGVLGLSRSLTVEAAKSLRDVVIRSNAIVPGYIDTPMVSGILYCSGIWILWLMSNLQVLAKTKPRG